MQDNMKVIFFTTLLLFSLNGFAFNWKKVVEIGNSFYVDVDTIKKHNGLVYYWQLTDYIEPSPYGDYSSITKYKVDCGEEKQIFLSGTYYSQPMGKGRITSEGTTNSIEHPKPNTIRYALMKFACDNAK